MWCFCLIFLLYLFGPSLFLVIVNRGLSILFTLSENHFLLLLFFFPYFLSLIYFLIDICYFLPSDNYRLWVFFFFALLFVIILGGRLDCLKFFLLLKEDMYHLSFLLRIAFVASHRILYYCIFIVTCNKVFFFSFI